MMSRAKWFAKLTPKMAWEQYVSDSVEKFISEFYAEGVTDVAEMCRRYARDIAGSENQLFTLDQLERIAKLLEQYILETGYDESRQYTEEELEKIWEKNMEELFKLLSNYARRKGCCSRSRMKCQSRSGDPAKTARLLPFPDGKTK